MTSIGQFLVSLDGVVDSLMWVNIVVGLILFAVFMAANVFLLPAAVAFRLGGIPDTEDEQQRKVYMLIAGTYTPIRPAGLLMLLSLLGLGLSIFLPAYWVQSGRLHVSTTAILWGVYPAAALLTFTFASYLANRWPEILAASRIVLIITIDLSVVFGAFLLKESHVAGRGMYILLLTICMLAGLVVGQAVWSLLHKREVSIEAEANGPKAPEADADRLPPPEVPADYHTADALVQAAGVVEESVLYTEPEYEETRCLRVRTAGGETLCCWMTDGHHSSATSSYCVCQAGPLQGAAVRIKGHVRLGLPGDKIGLYSAFAYIEADEVRATDGSARPWRRPQRSSQSSRHFPCAMSAWWSGEWLAALQVLGAQMRKGFAAYPVKAADEATQNIYKAILRSVLPGAKGEGPANASMAEELATGKFDRRGAEVLLLDLLGEEGMSEIIIEPLIADFGRFLGSARGDVPQPYRGVSVVPHATGAGGQIENTAFVKSLDREVLQVVPEVLWLQKGLKFEFVALSMGSGDFDGNVAAWRAVTEAGAALCCLDELMCSSSRPLPFDRYLGYAWGVKLFCWDGKNADALR